MHSLSAFFWYVTLFCLFLPSHPAQASACRSSGLFFHQIPPFCIHYHHIAQMSNKRSSGYRPTRSFPPTRRTHSAQTSYKHSSGLIFSFKPFTSASITFPSSPDECLSLIWAIFSPDPSFLFPQPSHQAQMSIVARSGCFFFFHLSPDLSFPSHLRSHLTQTSCKRSSGCIFNTVFSSAVPPLSQPHPAQTSIKHSSGLFFSPLPFTSTTVMISISPGDKHLSVLSFRRIFLFDLIQSRRATSARLAHSVFLPYCLM